MKKNRYLGGVLTLYLLTNVLFLIYIGAKHEKEKSLVSTIRQLENDKYSLWTTWIESDAISQLVTPPEEILTPGSFVLAFPENICDACNIWLFCQLESLNGSVEIEAVAPQKVKRKMMVFNDVYNLHLSHIKSSDAFVLPSAYHDEYGDFAYIFYYSKEKKMVSPLLLNNKTFDLKSYCNLVKMIFQEE